LSIKVTLKVSHNSSAIKVPANEAPTITTLFLVGSEAYEDPVQPI
jgi:hypothetical protein